MSRQWTAQSGVYLAQAPHNSPPAHSRLAFEMVDFSMNVDIHTGVLLRACGAGVMLLAGRRGYRSV